MFEDDWHNTIQEKDKALKIKEQRIRAEVVEFMSAYGIFMKLSQPTIAKAIVIYHRATLQLSFEGYDPLSYGAASIFLTSKLDDTPRGLEESVRIFDYFHHIYQKYKNGLHDENEKSEAIYKDVNETGYLQHKMENKKVSDLKEKFTDIEANILNLIGYDFDIELPYHYLDKIKSHPIVPHTRFLQIANNFINDSMRTLACLVYEPRCIALAALNLASIFLAYKFPNQTDQSWYHCFGDDIEFEHVQKVTDYLMELYKPSNK